MIRTLGPKVDLAGLIADACEEGREVHLVKAGPTKAETLDALARALEFPSWFGHNLDALADCLEELASQAVSPWELIIDDLAPLASADRCAYSGLHLVLADLVRAHPAWQVTMIKR